MDRKKIKADNVEQLLDIVRAIQNGEEPVSGLTKSPSEEEASAKKTKKQEKSRPKKKMEEEAAEDRRQDSDEEDIPEDEFERILDEEGEPDFGSALHRISSGAGAALDAVKKFGNKLALKARPDEKQDSGPEIFTDSHSGTQDSLPDSASGNPSEKTRLDLENSAPGPEGGRAPGRIAALKEFLAGRRIHRREGIMLGTGAVLVILILVLLVGGLHSFHTEKVKGENVTADEGLTVTVEQQPDQWCSSYPVVLCVRSLAGTVTGVTVNGEEYVPDENDRIVVIATDHLLEAVAATEAGTQSASIEIPMIDSGAPVVSVSRERETITVTAADARSSVSKIYYASVRNDIYNALPEYRLYSGPLTYESDTMYYFYAEDKAGNCSVPVVTTTETASAMTLSQEELALFPEETGYLSVKATPEGALLNNLKFESANPDVVTVTGSGAVTAAGVGDTVIRVSADGLDPISCPVEVSAARTVTISALGDCTLGTDASFNTQTNFDAFYAVYGYDYFFENVRDILENDDATFANLEGPLTTSATKTTPEEYAFKGDPSYTQILLDGSVEAVTLANNHIQDYGDEGVTDTKNALSEAGINYCMNDEIALVDLNGITTAFIGIYELSEGIECESRVRSTIADAKEQGAQLVIVAFHWGTEKSNVPDEIQQSLAHTAVDCGADLVVGHHPHVLQGIEKYNGKYIVYSLGNFCFGGNSSPSDLDTIIFRQTFTVTGSSVETDDDIEIIPCTISSAEDYNNYQPTPAEGTEADRIMERLNEYSSSFGTAFTASAGT